MTLSDYERHLIGQLCWVCHAATQPCHRRQRRCPSCRRKWSYERRRVRWELLKAFALTATAHHATRTVRCSYPTAYRAFTDCRRVLARLADAEKRQLLGELELDESYFGGKRKGQRGRGSAGKVAVFGILERAGRVFPVVVPDCKKETLMAKIRATTVKGSVFYTDEFTSYNDVKSHGRHRPINHQEAFGIGRVHINGIEGFWSFAKRLYRQVHGVDRDHFPLYLAEYAFRYNHRDEHLPSILFEAMIQPRLQEDELA
ncbi:MAG: IS1595 family transposase [Pseudonocardiaceae bacterium]